MIKLKLVSSRGELELVSPFHCSLMTHMEKNLNLLNLERNLYLTFEILNKLNTRLVWSLVFSLFKISNVR